jgi:hypothetical protein
MPDSQMFVAGVLVSGIVLMFFVFSAFELRKSHLPKSSKKARDPSL